MKLFGSGFLSVLSLTATLLISKSVRVVAQIVPDNSLGSENSVVVPDVDILGSDGNLINSDRIDGGAIRGNNLFHSFQEFNINDGRGAYFSNPEGITNILSRVTGGNGSNILGTLGVLGNVNTSTSLSVNLFLINPNGIVFGPNARLDVGGSFFASSGDGLLFENGFEFTASNPEAPPLLTINIPIGLNLRDNPGSLTVQGSGLTQLALSRPIIIQDVLDEPRGLAVPVGETLGLLGGNLLIDGGLVKAESGRVELGAVGDNSFVRLVATDTGFTLSYDQAETFQQLEIRGRAGVFVSGARGGEIQMVAQQLIASEGAEIQSSTFDNISGGQIDLKASDISINGTTPESMIPTQVVTETFGSGNAGNIQVEAERLTVQDGAAIVSRTFGMGSGGVVKVIASDITIQEAIPTGLSTSIIASGSSSLGNAGDVIIQTDRLRIQDGGAIGNIRVFGEFGNSGDAASVNIQASEWVEIGGMSNNGRFPATIEAGTLSAGNAGNINIETNQLIMRAQGVINAATTGSGSAGNITINASESIVLDGSQRQSNFHDPTNISAQTVSPGTAGNIILNTGQLQVSNGAFITAQADQGGDAGNITVNATNGVELGDQSLVSVLTTNSGNAGTINIKTGDLRIRDGGLLAASTLATGNAGNITISANETIKLSGIQSESAEFFGAITAFSAGEGDAGNITLTANEVLVQDGSGLNVAAFSSGNAGTINMTAVDTVEITGVGLEGTVPSQVSAATFGTGNAGTVTITTENLVLQNGGRVEVETQNAGNAGQIAIAANSVSLTGINNQFSSQLRASTSGSGSAGNITVQAQNLSLADGAEILASTTDEGNAGTINLTVSEIELTGNRPSLITAQTEAGGNAGNIIINANQFTTEANSGVEASSTGTGNGGSIQVTVSESVLLQEGGFLTALTEQTGNAGDVAVETENLILQNQGEINVRSLSTGIPGNIDIEATNLQLINQSLLNANSAAGEGGSINLQSSDIRLLENSSILATGSETGPTFEGDITIDADLLTLLQASRIVTDASNPTGGSNIEISPLNNQNIVIVQSNDSQIVAAGNLTIDSSVTFKPAEVPEVAVVNPNDLIAQEFCRQRKESEFIVTGKGGIEVDPMDKATGDQIEVDLVEPVSRQHQNLSLQPSYNTNDRAATVDAQPISSLDIIPARGWIRDENGDVILVSYDPTKIGIQRQFQSLPSCQ